MCRKSIRDQQFLGPIQHLLLQGRELLVLIEYSRAAGKKSFEFTTSCEDFKRRLKRLPSAARVTVFMQPQLPIRGSVDDNFIETCLRMIPDQTEFLVLETIPRIAGTHSWFHYEAGISHEELIETLSNSRGLPVAVGKYPYANSDEVFSLTAYAKDGETGAGVY